jgi:hypothetical protein
VTRIALAEGANAGAVLGSCVVVLAAIGLAPSFSWVPEVPLLALVTLLPLGVFGLTGFQVGLRSRRMFGGLLAGAVVGAISGGAGGLSYVLFGRPLLNIAVGSAAQSRVSTGRWGHERPRTGSPHGRGTHALHRDRTQRPRRLDERRGAGGYLLVQRLTDEDRAIIGRALRRETTEA